MTLDEIIADEFKRVEQIILGHDPDDVLMPSFIGYDDSQVTIAIVVPDMPPRFAAKFAGKMLIENNCVAYCVSSESWFISKKIDKSENLQKTIDATGLPSESPDRKEAVVIYAENAIGESKAKLWVIFRNENGKITKLTEEPTPPTGQFWSNSFSGLLRTGRERVN
jgi:hypothetical protein